MYGPNGLTQDVWEPAKLEENWGFIREARTLVKRYGPTTTLFDIFSEGAVSPYQENIPRVQAYTAELWRRYSAAFGLDDVTVSVIGKGRDQEAPDRVRNLIAAIRSTGLPPPRWFGIHPDFDGPRVLAELKAFDATLRALGLDQPLVLGEMSYENASVADAVTEFTRTSERHVLELYEWPQTIEGGPCPNPPYRADAYRTALTGQPPTSSAPLTLAPIPALRASVNTLGRVKLLSASGATVTTLDAGRYRLMVDDRSARAGSISAARVWSDPPRDVSSDGAAGRSTSVSLRRLEVFSGTAPTLHVRARNAYSFADAVASNSTPSGKSGERASSTTA
jgi:hypothetical protein